MQLLEYTFREIIFINPLEKYARQRFFEKVTQSWFDPLQVFMEICTYVHLYVTTAFFQ